MTDETRSRPGVKNATGLESYAQRIAAMDARKGEANTERAVLERDLGLELESFQRMQREPDHQRLYREFFRALGVAVKDSGLPTFEAVSELLGRFRNVPVQPSATTPAGSCPTGLPLIWEVVRDATAAKDRGDRAEEDRLLALAKRHLDLWVAINKRPGAREELGAYAKVPEPDPHKEAREQARAFAEANAKTWREPSEPDLIDALGSFLKALQKRCGSHATVGLELEEEHFLALAKESGVQYADLAHGFRVAKGPSAVQVKRRK